MILAVDVSYREDRAVTAGALLDVWDDCEPRQVLVTHISGVAPYQPGQFYRRELPCILALLDELGRVPEQIVVDGYVYLGKKRRAGLGRHLYDALDGRAAVIGVAKSRFRATPAAEILRGRSRRPLYVTAVGISEAEAGDLVASMCGEHRVPAILRLVDRLSKRREEGP